MLLTSSVTLPEYKLVQFEFQMKSTLTREEIEGIIKEDMVIQKESIQNMQAFLLNQRHGITRQNICSLGLGSNAGITRAKTCFKCGYDPGKPGRHRKLCIEDEDMLFNWIRKLNAKGQTVFISTVIEMV